MDAKVKEFIESKKAEEQKKYDSKKNEILIELGLYEKEYAPQGSEYSEEYPFGEWDETNQVNKFYKKIPAVVTDEEYREILRLSKRNGEKANSVAAALTFIAIAIFICGFIAGIIIGCTEVSYGSGFTYTKTEFSFAIALTYWAISLISGVLILGLAEIIKLLEAIRDKK